MPNEVWQSNPPGNVDSRPEHLAMIPCFVPKWWRCWHLSYATRSVLSVFRVSDNERSVSHMQKHEVVSSVLVPSSDSAAKMFRVWILRGERSGCGLLLH